MNFLTRLARPAPLARFVVGVSIFICGQGVGAAILFTELGHGPSLHGQSGDQYVHSRYLRYLSTYKDKGCFAEGPGHRILLTGFSRYGGMSYNISGAAVASMASESFWPTSIDLKSQPDLGSLENPALKIPSSGSISHQPAGVAIYNRHLQIDDVNYEVCFVVTDPLWDYAAAIVVHEATRFKPEMTLMTGRSEASAFINIEAAAVNRTINLKGAIEPQLEANSTKHWWQLSSEESPDNQSRDNRPHSTWILNSYPTDEILQMNWNTQSIAHEIAADAHSLNYEVRPNTTIRNGNSFICNNLSFIVLNAALNRPSRLAGDLIILPSPDFKKQPIVGFIHLPPTDFKHPNLSNYSSGVWTVDRILATIISSQVH